MDNKRIMKVYDSNEFYYEVYVTHSPSFGLSTANYLGRIISVVQHYKLAEPDSDNDAEWEEYDERFAEYMDEAESDLYPACKEYFDHNRQLQ
jgi:polyphosphate kinase 2 (PPK2 family)